MASGSGGNSRQKDINKATELIEKSGVTTKKAASKIGTMIGAMPATKRNQIIKMLKDDVTKTLLNVGFQKYLNKGAEARKIRVYLQEASDKEKRIEFPVLPASFSISDGQNNVVVNITTLGDANLPGKKALRELTLTSFFPNQNYSFLVCRRKSDPYSYIEWLRKRKNKGTIMRIIISGADINFMCLIESLEYGEDDATGDVNFTIELKEYVSLKSSEKKKSSKKVSKSKPKTYVVKKGDTLKKIAKKYLGSSSKSKQLYKKNKKVIEKAFQKWKKEQNKKKKGSVKAKNSQNGKYLVKGTKLVL